MRPAASAGFAFLGFCQRPPVDTRDHPRPLTLPKKSKARHPQILWCARWCAYLSSTFLLCAAVSLELGFRSARSSSTCRCGPSRASAGSALAAGRSVGESECWPAKLSRAALRTCPGPRPSGPTDLLGIPAVLMPPPCLRRFGETPCVGRFGRARFAGGRDQPDQTPRWRRPNSQARSFSAKR
jgi:hypothetical protein